MSKDEPELRCPACRAPVPGDAPNRPFCSERCRVLDLASWATEEYRIPGPPSPDPEEDDA